MPKSNTLDDVRRVNASYRDRIVRTYNAIGTGIGRVDGQYVITVYIRNIQQRPTKEVLIEGVPLRFEVTGEITPHTSR